MRVQKLGMSLVDFVAHQATVEYVKVHTDTGDLIGTVAEVALPDPTGSFGRRVWVADAHDWDSDAEYDRTQGREYDPICIGAFDDPEQALNEIERRARQAQAPETVRDANHQPYYPHPTNPPPGHTGGRLAFGV